MNNDNPAFEITDSNDGLFEEFITANPDKQNEMNKKTEKEIIQKRKKQKENKKVETRSIKDVPKDLLFTKHTVWNATNLKTLIEFELSGLNVNLYLGESPALRQLLVGGHTDSFHKDGLYIKFSKFTC